MADMTELKNMVRKGIVHSVNKKTMKARVKFPDKGGIISGELFILTRPRYIIPEKDKEEKKNEVETVLNHTHNAYITPWTPEIGSMVLCLMIADGDGEGYILGGIQ